MQKAEETMPAKVTRSSVPRGVYWPGEYTFQSERTPGARWKKIESIFRKLEEGGVNTIWLTHTSTSETAEWSRRAEKYGIRLVAATDESSPDRTVPPPSEQRSIVKNAVKDWGSAPPPIAWGLCDEPELEFMEDLHHYTQVWQEQGQPVTTVIIPTNVNAAGRHVKGLNYFCVDPYPFFSEHNPNGPNNHVSSIQYYLDTCKNAALKAEESGSNLWIMAQIFQDPMGPWNLDERGNVVYLPGGGPHWRMPSPAEVTWQGWAALAEGARGVFFYSLFLANPDNAIIQSPPENAKFLVNEATNTGSPIAILYPNGESTPQFDAMSGFFKSIRDHEAILLSLGRTENALAHLDAAEWPGDVVSSFRTKEGIIYLIVVNGNLNEKSDIAVNLVKEAEFSTAIDLRSNVTLAISDREHAKKQFQISLNPGEGTLIRLENSEAKNAVK